ncbi:exonuclease SbcCD subunit D [Corynebacterium sp. YSMAA1_1_F7]|uniref:metallophosphoesterase family protein n=1 Tax=Corynebacterium sp. YSMAA1_1_F7 TaxID=3383590 RepID=UPI0038D0DA84
MTQPLAAPSAHRARIVHTSDWQLGMRRRFLSAEAQSRFDESRLEAVEALLELAQERECDAIVVAGDVFDDNLLKPEIYGRAMDVLKRSTVPVFLLPGNHDPLDAASVYHREEFDELDNVYVLKNSEPVAVPNSGGASVDGASGAALEIVGAPLRGKSADEDLVAAALSGLSQVKGAGIRVMVGHGAVNSFGERDDFDRIDVANAARACQERKVDYVALGDTHSAIPLDADSAQARVWYSGAQEVTDFIEEDGRGEANSGNVLVVDIGVDPARPEQQAQVQVEEVPVGRWAFQALNATVNSAEDIDEFLERLEAIESKRTTVIKYALQGTLSVHDAAYLDEQVAKIRPTFAALYERERLMDLHVIPDEEELSEGLLSQGFIGEAAQKLKQLAETESKDPQQLQQAQQAQDALRLLMRLARHAEQGK